MAGPIKVPGNYVPIIDQVSQMTGVPFSVIAAVIQSQVGWPNTIIPQQILQVGQKLAQAHDQSDPNDPSWSPDWSVVAANIFGSGSEAWRSRFNDIYGPSGISDTERWVYDTNNQSPRESFVTPDFGGGIGGDRVAGVGGVGKQPLIPGLSDDSAQAVQRVADSLYLKYLGRFPTNAEYLDLSKNSYTPAQVEEHLRAAPYNGTTVGQWQDAKSSADKYAQDRFGRDADPGEVNFLVSNDILDPESVSAYYDQLRTRRDTGDPTFAWVSNPTTWRDTEKTVDALWKRAGLTGTVDPHLVNEAITGKMSQDEITTRIEALPAPGFAVGTTVGEVNRLRDLATASKKSLLPTEGVTKTELDRFIAQKASPEDILGYYRSVVPANSKTGLPIGAESDYRSMAKKVLEQFGITYEPTPEDIRFFAMTQSDPQGIQQHYAQNPAILARHPGLAYGMGTEEFAQTQKSYGDAYSGVFPGAQLPNGLLDYSIKQKVSPGEVSRTSEQFRQERGRAPSTTEFQERFTRPQSPNQTGRTAVMPIAPSPDTRDKGRPSPAVSA